MEDLFNSVSPKLTRQDTKHWIVCQRCETHDESSSYSATMAKLRAIMEDLNFSIKQTHTIVCQECGGYHESAYCLVITVKVDNSLSLEKLMADLIAGEKASNARHHMHLMSMIT